MTKSKQNGITNEGMLYKCFVLGIEKSTKLVQVKCVHCPGGGSVGCRFISFDFRFVEYLNFFSKLQTVDLEQISCMNLQKITPPWA